MPWALFSSSARISALAEARRIEHRHREQVGERRGRLVVATLLRREHVDLVVVQRVQRRRRRRRHPGAYWRRHWDGRSWPSSMRPCRRAAPTCPCRSAPGRRSRSASPISDIAVLVGTDPALRLDARPCAAPGRPRIEVWISSPVRSRKPVLMKNTRCRAAWMQALRLAEVRRSSSMMPILMVCSGEAEHALRPRRRSSQANWHFLRPVHLGLDDVDGAGASSCDASSVVQGAERRHRRIDSPSPTGWPSASSTAVGRHQVPDIAHQQQRPALEREVPAVGIGEAPVGVEHAVDVLPSFSNVSSSVPFISPSQLR